MLYIAFRCLGIGIATLTSLTDGAAMVGFVGGVDTMRGGAVRNAAIHLSVGLTATFFAPGQLEQTITFHRPQTSHNQHGFISARLLWVIRVNQWDTRADIGDFCGIWVNLLTPCNCAGSPQEVELTHTVTQLTCFQSYWRGWLHVEYNSSYWLHKTQSMPMPSHGCMSAWKLIDSTM